MWVIKIGGSLQDSPFLKDWLDAIKVHGEGKVILVPGGGKFADAVREQQKLTGLSDELAHGLALRAMEQYASLLMESLPGLQPVDSVSSMQQCLDNGGLPLWLPYRMCIADVSLPASWDVSSDSLAAWLAIKLDVNSLILVKSASLPAEYTGCQELARLGLVDNYMAELLDDSALGVRWMCQHEAALLPGVLAGSHEVPDINWQQARCRITGRQ